MPSMHSRCLFTLTLASALYQVEAISQDDFIVRREGGNFQVHIGTGGEIATGGGTASHSRPRKMAAHHEAPASKSPPKSRGHSGLLQQSGLQSKFALVKTRSLLGLFGSSLNISNVLTPNKVIPSKTIYESPMFITLCVFGAVGALLSVTASILARNSAPAASEEGGDGATGSAGSDQTGGGGLVEKELTPVPEGLDEDIYGMGIAAIIRDMQRFSMKTEAMGLRMSRLSISLLTLSFTLVLQVFLLVEMKHLVTSVSTLETRTAYDSFEVWMYGNNKDAMTITENGYHRGVASHFNITAFATLDEDVKDNACQIPLSQPTFFIGVLLIWTLVIVADMRRVMNLGGALIRHTPTIASMADSLIDTPEEGDEAVLVVGLTTPVKAMIAGLILIPRFLVSACLLWLGCRWLCGTMGFGDILQNTVTLEFILLLKDLFYHTMAPHHNKVETRSTMIMPNADKQNVNAPVFLGAFAWGICAIAWVLLYVECLQQVLPEYNWDIHDACQSYLASVEGQEAS